MPNRRSATATASYRQDNIVPIGINDASDETRFGRRVEVRSNGCWAFNGALSHYGTFNRIRRNGMKAEAVLAHRFAYETLVGPIPSGHVLHHRCENPGCVNPAHLAALTPKRPRIRARPPAPRCSHLRSLHAKERGWPGVVQRAPMHRTRDAWPASPPNVGAPPRPGPRRNRGGARRGCSPSGKRSVDPSSLERLELGDLGHPLRLTIEGRRVWALLHDLHADRAEVAPLVGLLARGDQPEGTPTRREVPGVVGMEGTPSWAVVCISRPTALRLAPIPWVHR